MATHSIPFVWRAGVRELDYSADRVACGKKVYVEGVRTRTVTNSGGAVTCTSCLRLLAMSEVQYLAHLATEAKKLQDVRTAQRQKADVAKQQKYEQQWAEVYKYQDDALVAQDAFLSGAEYPLMDEVLQAVVLRQRLCYPKSRGEKLWLFGPEVSFDVEYRQKKRVINCRFCRKQIGVGELGRDYSRSVFDVRSWREFNSMTSYRRVYGDSPSYVCVSRHTTLCALAYLAGTTCVEPVPE